MVAGTSRIGHVVSADESDAVASATFDDRGVVLVWPRQLGFIEAFGSVEKERTVQSLVFRDAHGWLTLREGHTVGTTASSTGSSEERLRFPCALRTGARGVDYAGVNGMASEIDGLGTWAKMSAVRSELRLQEKRIAGVSIHAENLEAVDLGGPLALTLETSYRHSPTPKGGVYSISDALRVRTKSSDLVPWKEHAAAHHMIQDLMCLVYGKAIGARLVSVMREDDQELEPTDDRRFWIDAYEPTFGRGNDKVVPLADEATPLFFLDETNPTKVAAWLQEFALWSRPTWIAVTTLFQRDSTVEAQLLQMGVALEALGNALWRRDNPGGVKAPTYYPGLLQRVTDAVQLESQAVYGGDSVDSWRNNFNQAFKGIKHADQDLPEAAEAHLRWKQAFTLIRCWLAVELGVDRDLLVERLAQGR